MRQSLLGLLNFWRKKQPDSPAFISSSGKLTYSQLWEKASSVAEVVMQSGGAFVGIAMRSQDLTIISLIATMLCKKLFLILDTESEFFTEIVKTSKIDTIISDMDSLSSLGLRFIKVDKNTIINSSKMSFDYSIDMNDEVGAFLSSGTTGIPKVFMRSNYSLVSEAFLWKFELELTPKTRFYLSGQLSYIGTFVLLYSVLYSGGLVLMDISDRSPACVTYAFYTVKEINDILYGKRGTLLPVVAKKVLTMGAPIDYKTKQNFADLYHCDVLEMWGNSEGLATLISLKDKHSRRGSIGRATFTDDLFITDKNGRKLDAYQIGYISGITDNDTSSSASDIIVSEDLGYMDKDGYFYLVGRDKNVIVLPNNKYFSTIHFEKWIKEHAQVEDCVVAIRNDRIHIDVFLVTSNSIEWVSLLKSYLDSFEGNIILGRIIELNQIPYNINGKVNYVALNNYIK